ncbi:DNA translocase FtsK [Chloroflexota bacterium]
MAKGKAGIKGNAQRKTKAKPRRGGLFQFGFLLLAALAAIVALSIWQWSNLTSWAADIAVETLRLFGWGLVFVTVAVVALLVIILLRKLSSLIRRWNRFLGSIAFVLAVWGLLAFFPGTGTLRVASLGGNFGLSIIGQDIVAYPVFISVLRVLGLVVGGIVLVAPRACFHLVEGIFLAIVRTFERRPAPQPLPEEKPLPPQVAREQEESASAVMETRTTQAEPEKKIVAPEIIPSHTQQELRQVAQEVWKKYGESPSLVIVDGWRLPPIEILDRFNEVEFSQADNMQRAKLIEDALASYGVETKVVQINVGPTVTQFGVEPGWDRKMKEIRERDKDGNVRTRTEEVSRTRVKVDRITSLSNDLALALAAPSIRIEAPVPGQSVVGIEVPNTILGLVGLRGVIETAVFQKLQARSKLTVALGKGAGGEAVSADLTRMPHLLIAGATGSGKTVCLNAIICCLLLHNTPNDVKLIMIDPKRVELTPFNSIPHLAAPVIVDTDKALSVLRWLNKEMDKRYQKLAAAAARNIEAYNKNKQGEEKLPYLVLVIDELADLMMAGFDEVEHILCRLAQLARATGIHLVVATQRPSVDVITGLIKANFPTRISFAVTSQVDSRTILDSGGAEKLLGRGDMLYMPTEAAKPKRLQGCFVSDAETERLVYFWGNQRREEAAPLKVEELIPPGTFRKTGAPEDSLLDAARQLAKEHKHISTSFLQRKLSVGYPRAARIMEQLQEEEGAGEAQSD